MNISELLDEKVENFFPQNGNWRSNCFRKSKIVSEENLPCNLRDDKWLADLIMKKYDLYSLGKDTILEYIINSEKFNKLRHEYELKIVKWQINWMKNDGESWLCENEFYLFNPNCDHIFRKGIVDTLLAIGMDKDVIEEGIEKDLDWLERMIWISFCNQYNIIVYNLDGNNNSLLKATPEHFENFRKMKLYDYYLEHKDVVDKYGKVQKEMRMTNEEVEALREWLNIEHDKRKKQIENYKYIFNSQIKINIDFQESILEKDKPKSLIKRLFNSKK